MRLINIETLELEEFFGSRIPRFAILSHTWENQEITFQDYNWILNYEQELKDGIIDELSPKQQLRIRAKYEALKNRTGYSKIYNFVLLARGYRNRPLELVHSYYDGLRLKIEIEPVNYVWVDTCCINKESSAELSEAINSMYEWYARAEFCVAVLSDVSSPPLHGLTTQEMKSQSDLPQSRWFTRGWTLQELLVPEYVNFHNQDWTYIASKVEILELLKDITGISRGLLTDQYGMRSASVATKMSWAAHRTTTRVEDEAYCLLGLFGVNMPLLYGEGERAFQRLQHEIVRTSDDLSILVWGYDQPRAKKFERIFASSPREFVRCSKMFPAYEAFPELRSKPFFLTNIGLHISVHLYLNRNGVYAVLPVKDNRGWLLGIALAGRDSTGGLRLVEDGTAMAREAYDQPLALFRADSVRTGRIGHLGLKTLIIPHNPPPPQSSTGRLGTPPEEFLLNLSSQDNIDIIEYCSPSPRVSQQDGVRKTLSFHGLPRASTTVSSKGMVRVPIKLSFYFRARLRRKMGQPSDDFVVNVNLDETSGNLLLGGVWQWDYFRSPSTAPSMAALFLERKEQQTETRFEEIYVDIDGKDTLPKSKPWDDMSGVRLSVFLNASVRWDKRSYSTETWLRV